MTRLVLSLALLAAALALSQSAQAGSLTRTFVSSAGNDANACTVTAPCRTFAGAYANTAANGIISALDPAGYGSLNISGPVTVDGNGWAAVTVPTTGNATGIRITAGSSDNVVLRGLIVDGAGASPTTGISFITGGSLVVDGCIVRNTSSYGMFFSSSAATAVTLAVSDSFFINSSTANGIFVSSSGAGGITASIDHSQLSGNNINGLDAANNGGTGPVNVAVTSSVVANNQRGLVTDGDGTHVVNLTITDTQITGNEVSVEPFAAATTISLAGSTIVGNGEAYDAVTGTVNSFGDNYFAANGLGLGSLTPVSKQ